MHSVFSFFSNQILERKKKFSQVFQFVVCRRHMKNLVFLNYSVEIAKCERFYTKCFIWRMLSAINIRDYLCTKPLSEICTASRDRIIKGFCCLFVFSFYLQGNKHFEIKFLLSITQQSLINTFVYWRNPFL